LSERRKEIEARVQPEKKEELTDSFSVSRNNKSNSRKVRSSHEVFQRKPLFKSPIKLR
jgi:hypothetical protein